MGDETKTNVFSTGSGGSAFENSVLTAYVLTMLLDGSVPGFDSCSMTSIRLQAGTLGYRTDDMFIGLVSRQGTEHKFLGQIKHNVSITANNDIFKQVIKAFWEDYTNESLFNPIYDKLYLIKGVLNAKEANHVKPILDWAKSKNNYPEYKKELETSKEKLGVFDVFVCVIRELSGCENTTEEEVWEFLKVVELLDYDFSSDTSVDRASCLSLIQLAKNNESTSPEDIWANIFHIVSQKNPKGASFSKERLNEKLIFFDIQKSSGFHNSIKKIIDDGDLLFKRIENKIGDVHIKRQSIKEEIITAISNRQIIIISGDAGSGKSALSKEVLRELTNTKTIAFTADQFNRSRLSEVLSSVGVTENSISLFQSFTLFPRKIIYIDSLEKLLEDTAFAFSELISILEQQKNIQLVASCRGYALEFIRFKHFHRLNSSETIEIPLLSNDELVYVKLKIPKLASIIENIQINELLRIPKYLDYTHRLIVKTEADLSKVTEIELKKMLWNTIVKDSLIQTGSIHNRRENSFIQLAVRRAKEMTLFTYVDDLDSEAVMRLFNDGVLSKANDDFYSPSHDILEDWALIRFVEAQKNKSVTINDLFLKIGEEPAIRRGFRLWLLQFMSEQKESSYTFVSSVVFNDLIENHWRDEVIVSILNSDILPQFLQDNQFLLFNNSALLLKRFIHLLRVTCRDSNQFPKGSGWNTMLLFIYEQLNKLEDQDNLIIGLCLDWRTLLAQDRLSLPEESKFVGKIILSFLKKNRSVYNSYARKEELKEQVEASIKLLFQLSEVIQDDLEELLIEALNSSKQSKDHDWDSKSYYEKISEYALSGLYCGTLPKFFPSIIVELANHEWRKETVSTSTFYENPSDVEQYYGLKEPSRTGEVPSPSFTFVFKLLTFHPILALEFIIELMDYCSLRFVNSNFGNKGDCVELEFVFDDDTNVKKVGNQLLWQLYRGADTVTPYLLQGVLKALEKFMYLQGESNSDIGKENLDFCVGYLLRSSKSISTTAVVASLVMAFPDLLGHYIISLVGHVELFQWDSTRWMKDRINPLYMRPFSVEGYVFLEENKILDSWVHRKQHLKGLHGFIVDYQFNNGVFNKRIHQKFDKLKKAKDGKGFYWKKVLNEIDIRYWKPVRDSHEEPGKVLMQVQYEGDVKGRVLEFSKEEEKTNKNISVANWITKVYKGEETNPEYEAWNFCFEYYKAVDSGNEDVGFDFFSVPGTLACVGLNFFLNVLSEDEKRWCINKIGFICIKILEQEGKPYEFERNISLQDRKPCLTFLSRLLTLDLGIQDKDKVEIKLLIINLLVNLSKENDRDKLIEGVKVNLWKEHPIFCRSLIRGIIEFAKFRNKNSSQSIISQEERERINGLREVLFNSIVNETEIVVDQISYESHEHRVLEVAVELLPVEIEIDFTGSILLLLFESHNNAICVPKNRYRNYIQIGYQLKIVISNYFIYSNTANIEEMFIQVLSRLYELDSEYSNEELREFVAGILENIMYVVDKNVERIEKEKLIKNFWAIWEVLYLQILKHDSIQYTDQFLMKGSWASDAENWLPLETGRDFMMSSIPKINYFSVNTMIELLSGIGFKTLMPRGLDWVVLKMKSENYNVFSLDFTSAERLVEKTYREYTQQIKEVPERLNDFIWLLDVLIDGGSSRSYLIRENILLYKQKTGKK